MNAAQLVEGYKRILKTIYSPSEYYARSLECLHRVKQNTPEPQGNNALLNLLSLARTLFTLGIRDRERAHFWRFLGHVFARHPRRLPQAIVLASLGYHYRRITEDLLWTPVSIPDVPGVERIRAA
jgi:hypothetical protein